MSKSLSDLRRMAPGGAPTPHTANANKIAIFLNSATTGVVYANGATAPITPDSCQVLVGLIEAAHSKARAEGTPLVLPNIRLGVPDWRHFDRKVEVFEAAGFWQSLLGDTAEQAMLDSLVDAGEGYLNFNPALPGWEFRPETKGAGETVEEALARVNAARASRQQAPVTRRCH